MTLVQYYPRNEHTARHTNHWVPAADVTEHENNYTLEVDLPGFEKADFTLKLNDGVLTLSGDRKRDEHENGKYYHSYERPAGTFTRSFRFPDDVDTAKVNATYENGVLTLQLEKKETAKPRSIKIT